jgi:prefoldin subunit 5
VVSSFKKIKRNNKKKLLMHVEHGVAAPQSSDDTYD